MASSLFMGLVISSFLANSSTFRCETPLVPSQSSYLCLHDWERLFTLIYVFVIIGKDTIVFIILTGWFCQDHFRSLPIHC